MPVPRRGRGRWYRRWAVCPRYRSTLLEIGIETVGDADGWALVDNFVATCPIYNTVRRGSGIEVTPPEADAP
ncbi:hypothetical protein [Nocardia sp. NPDC019395]|uniref:hypothetical protein n=1 Tax=Nocardia sp. NPDC019395 TaxID=3154686 RepID=UPI0033E05BE6